MPELIINGPGGRIEARYHHEPQSDGPIALVLHPHPQFGGTMNNQVVYSLYHTFAERGFSVLRFNFRGVGRSQGVYDGGPGELADAASALDWLQLVKPDARTCWIAGVSFGTWIAMQLLMRRPEVDGFICVAPPSNLYDFSFLAPCPSSGLIVNGDRDRVVPTASVTEMCQKVKVQRGITITHEVVPGANHFFEDKTEEMAGIVGGYLDRRMVEFEEERARAKEREREKERERQRQRDADRAETQSTSKSGTKPDAAPAASAETAAPADPPAATPPTGDAAPAPATDTSATETPTTDAPAKES